MISQVDSGQEAVFAEARGAEHPVFRGEDRDSKLLPSRIRGNEYLVMWMPSSLGGSLEEMVRVCSDLVLEYSAGGWP